MKQKNTVFNLLRPHGIIRESRQSLKNIFQSSIKADQREDNEPARFIAGEKEVRIYKNKLKRKQKLTSAHPGQLNLNKGKNMENNEILTRQDVIDCLPKGVRLIKNLENSLNEIRTMRANHRKEWSARREKTNQSNLIKTIDGYRELIEERQKSSRLNYLPNLQSLHWISTLRENRSMNRSTEKDQQILMKNKMMICGASKKRAEDKWLKDKENEGYGFRLLPNSYLLIRESKMTD